MSSVKKYVAEFIGTFVLVFFACGTAAVTGCKTNEINAAYFLTALAFGLVIVGMAYCVGNISGCHINPAVSLGVLISGGMNKGKAVLITALSGASTILGAFLGFLLGDIGALGLALSLGFASGAMLYVVFGEILPQAILMYHSKLPAFSAIVGILAGMLIIF